MTVADCDRDLWRSGRRQCPSHDIDCEYRVDLRSACSPPFAVPGIGESAGGEAAQCFDPLTTRGVTRVERGRYPIWGCSGLQQHTRLPSRSRTAENRGILSIGARTIELNVISTTAQASRTKHRIGIAVEEPVWPPHRSGCREVRLRSGLWKPKIIRRNRWSCWSQAAYRRPLECLVFTVSSEP